MICLRAPNVRPIFVIAQYALRWHLPEAGPCCYQCSLGLAGSLAKRCSPAAPRPRNFRWLTANPWFTEELLPLLWARVSAVLTAEASAPGAPRGDLQTPWAAGRLLEHQLRARHDRCELPRFPVPPAGAGASWIGAVQRQAVCVGNSTGEGSGQASCLSRITIYPWGYMVRSPETQGGTAWPHSR